MVGPTGDDKHETDADTNGFTAWWSALRGRPDAESADTSLGRRPEPGVDTSGHGRPSRLAVGRPAVTGAIGTIAARFGHGHGEDSPAGSSRDERLTGDAAEPTRPRPPRGGEHKESPVTRANHTAGSGEGGPAGQTGPEHLGPYRLLETLGEGGMGVVRLGLDAQGRAVAVKVLRDHVAHDPSARARLGREFDTLARVRHPRIAPVLDVDIDGPRPYLVTRYVPGVSLDRWVREHGPLTGDALARLGRGLAEALAAIHAVGVVHRDLKPGNVLMADGEPVVIDFGIAHLADETRLTSTGLVMGTPGYLPPELLDGHAANEATDWWAWAATVTFAATGRQPFGRGPMDAVFHRVYRGEADLGGVDPRLQGLLRAALDPDPTRRPERARVLDALDAYAQGRDATAAWSRDPAGRNGAESHQSTAPVHTRTSTRGIDREDAATTHLPQVMPRTQAQPVVPPPQQGHPATAPGAPTPNGPGAYASFGAPRRTDGWVPAGPSGGGPGAPGAGATAAAPWGVPGAVSRPDARRGVTAVLAAGFCVFLACAASWPLITLVAGLVWCVLARTVEESVRSLVWRRQSRGVAGPGDVVRAVVLSPLRLVSAVVTTLLLALVAAPVVAASLFAAPFFGVLTDGMQFDPLQELPLTIGALVSGILAWWGPASGPVRHGSRTIVRSITPSVSVRGVLAAGLIVVAVFLALRTQASGVVPDWTPVGAPSEWALALPW